MRNILTVNEGHALKDLLHVAFDIFNWDAASVLTNAHVTAMCFTQLLNSFFRVLDDLLEVFVAVFED